MSGFFSQIVQDVLSSGQQGQPSPIVGILEQVLAAKGGENQGVAGIISRFENAGLGQHVQSWVGTGENVPLSGDQVGQAFSREEIESWAQQAGTTPDTMRGVLAEALPHMVDHLTPGGQVPAQTGLSDLSGLIGRFLGGAGTSRPD